MSEITPISTRATQSPIPVISGMLSASQAKQPERLFDVLTITAVKESWINLLIHFHTAIFFGLILLASGYDGVTSITYLAIHLVASLISSVVLMLLIRQSPEQLIVNRKWAVYGLTFADVLTSLGWGVSILLFFISSSFDNASTLVVVLLAAGISSAALSAKLLHILMVGRILVFLPTIILLISQQPPDWLLHTTSLALSFGVCVGVGYAIHVQLLREASAMVQLAETQDQIVREAEFRERFLKSITHDLRQPLTSLGLHLRSLKNQSSDFRDNEQVEAIDTCLGSANRIMQNVSQLAWVSDTLPKPKLTAISLRALFESIVATMQPVAQRKGLDLSMVDTSLYCLAEQSYLERIVRNLVDNAIEYSDSGQILIGARNRESLGLVEIQVLDTGRGIAKSEWQRVFEKYQRVQSHSSRDAEHLGLGLSIVKSISESMGGSITLKSTLGKGSCFGVKLKLALAIPALTEPKVDNISSVLIVDDDKIYAQRLAAAARQLGISSELVCEPDAIDELFNDGLPGHDCYLIDYHLSQSQNGLDLIKLAPLTAKRYLVSNFDTPQLRLAASKEGIQFLSKPQGDSGMRRFLETHLHVKLKL